MKKGVNKLLTIFLVSAILFTLSINFVSAGWFSDTLNKITGKVTYESDELKTFLSDDLNGLYPSGGACVGFCANYETANAICKSKGYTNAISFIPSSWGFCSYDDCAWDKSNNWASVSNCNGGGRCLGYISSVTCNKSVVINNNNTCTPNCVGKTCGADSCGGSCGSCLDGQICSQGKCANDPANGFYISDVSFSPNSPKVGDEVRIYLKLRNLFNQSRENVVVTAVDQKGWGNSVSVDLFPLEIKNITLKIYASSVHLTYNPHQFTITAGNSSSYYTINVSNNSDYCTDSDNGLDYYTKGYLKNSLGVNFEDYCLNSSELIERHCLSSNPNEFTKQYTCPNGCSNGACIKINSCIITDIYSKQVLGYAYYNIFINAYGLPSQNNYTTSGSGTYESVSFKVISRSSDGSAVLQGGQTFNTVASSYILNRKFNISLVDSSKNIVCNFGQKTCTQSSNGIITSDGSFTPNTCVYNDDGSLKGVRKYSCFGNTPNSDVYPCQYGCLNGSCIDKPTCTDSDSGINYYQNGKVEGFNGNVPLLYERGLEYSDGLVVTSQNTAILKLNNQLANVTKGGTYIFMDQQYQVVNISYISPNNLNNSIAIKLLAVKDVCVNNVTLVEGYCNGNEFAGKDYVCPNGCLNGACVGNETPNQTTTCTDSDGGINYYVRGELKGIHISEGGFEGTDTKVLNSQEADLTINGKTVRARQNESVNTDFGTFHVDNIIFISSGNSKNQVLVTWETIADSCEGNDIVERYCEANNHNENVYQRYTCPNGCKNGACVNTTKINETEVNCKDGCLLDKKCYPFGYRKSGKYCSDSGIFKAQFKADTKCENNFECSSNVCVSGKCVSESFIQKVISWFRRIFGNRN